MLGWLAAAALPWLINLWVRRRHAETPWAAVDLLLAAVRDGARRLRLRELLLIALRTAIVALVAVAAARPEWHSAATAGRGERTHHIVVLDTSFSMAARSGEASRWERAKAHARALVEQAPVGDAFTVIGWSATAEDILGRPTFETADALAAIESLEPLDTAADLGSAARAVEAAIAAAGRNLPDVRRTRTIFLSDFALNTWGATLASAPSTAARDSASADRPSADGWDKLSAAGEIVLENVGDGARHNLAITAIHLEPPRPLLDVPLTLAVQVKSFGSEPPSAVEVELLHNGTSLGRQSAAPSPGGEATLRFETRLVEPKSHVFEARLPESGDVLAVDDRRWIVTEPALERRALCVADDAAASADIARALNPRRAARAASDSQPPGEEIAVESIAAAKLASADLASFDAIFLANVAELTERERRLLTTYVAGGGGLAVVLGSRVRPASYNQFLGGGDDSSPNHTPLLAVKIADEPASGDWRLDPLDYRHAIVAPFAGHTRAGLLSVRVARYFPLRVTNSGEPEGPRTAVGFTSNDPALVIGDFGQGRVAVLATDPALTTDGEPWSSLAVSPAFVPLVRELFSYLTADRHAVRHNRLVGEVLAAPNQVDFTARPGLVWTSPSGRVSTWPPATAERGVYTLASSGGADIDGTAAPTYFAVNVDPAESDLATVDLAELQAARIAAGTAAASSAGQVASIPLSRFLLAAAIVLTFVELTVAWLAGRGWA